MPPADGLEGLLFDCDGVIADTERDGHRVAFNQAFASEGMDLVWDEARYGALLTTGGGKERMRRHFDETKWPVPEEERDDLIARLHKEKTDRFLRLIAEGKLPLRAGVQRLVDEALAAGVKVAVCSTSNERAVGGIVRMNLGDRRADKIPIFAGDIVPAKKPDPAIYNLAAESLGLDPARCVVIEDSNNGLRAAHGAGMACIVTVSFYTADEDFSLAAKIVPELGDGAGTRITLGDCAALVR
ncbi:MAG: HAD family hydrolase [Pseudomonadota bacterium]